MRHFFYSQTHPETARLVSHCNRLLRLEVFAAQGEHLRELTLIPFVEQGGGNRRHDPCPQGIPVIVLQ